MTATTDDGVTGATPGTDDWDTAVSEAARHVQERGAAEQAAVERLKPASDGPKIAVFALMLVAIAAWDVRAWTQAPEPMPAATEQVHMSWVVVDVADAVEDFRLDEGRLPTGAELAELVDEDIQYRIVGESYEVVVTGEGGSLTYDGSIPVREWAAIQGATASAPGEAS